MDKYAVIGNPIAHSLSPLIHKAFAEQTGQDITYSAILAPKNKFALYVQSFQKKGGKGLNVTAPFKEEACKLADTLTHSAKEAHAVNTLCFESNGKIFGDNTDGEGFIRDVCANQGGSFEQKRILLLGAGGAIRGLLYPIIQHHPKTIVIANRTLSKAESLAMLLAQTKCPVFSLSLPPLKKGDRGGFFFKFDWIIHGIGRGVDITHLLPRSILSPNTWCYDLSYGARSPFLDWAKQNGATHISDGLGLLVEQAALSFYRWRGVKPETAAVLQKLRDTLR